MSLSHYDYSLPTELIAQKPLPNRSDARLLVVNRRTQSFQHRSIRDLPEFFGPKDCLVLNDTKVVPARLIGKRTNTGGHWEGLFLQLAPQKNLWQVMGKTRGTLRIGETVLLHSPDNKKELLIELVAKQDDQTLLVHPVVESATESLLDQIGWVPIPPYVRKGKPLPYDKERYQTVYAAHSGSIAAPTAGLHLTPELLETVQQRGTRVASVTLHVGLGTFKPITSENIEDHHMHSEWCSQSAESASTIQQCRRHGGRIIAVGTTSVRVLESVLEPFQAFETSTSLFIRPPYRFRNVDALLTNFHFPKSTLLILVRTFGGDELIQEAYREAIRKRYRFFSYGDAMLIY